jgi:hypothetical protein
MKNRVVRTCLALCALVLLSSCAPRVALRLAPEARGLEPLIRAHLAAWQKGAKARFVLVPEGGKVRGSFAATVYVSGAQSATAGKDGREIPRNLAELKSWSAPPALLEAAMGPHGGFGCVPLFWDCLGVTFFDREASLKILEGDRVEWPSLETSGSKLSVAGGEPDLRGAIGALVGSRGELAREVQKTRWGKDAFRFLRSDFVQGYKQGTRLVYLENFRDFQSKNTPGHRNFYPIVRPVGKDYLATGPWLAFRVSGRADAARLAAPLLAGLIDADFQKEVGMRTGWLPANLLAPDLNAESRRAMRVLGSAAEFESSNGLDEKARLALDEVFLDPKRYAGEK